MDEEQAAMDKEALIKLAVAVAGILLVLVASAWLNPVEEPGIEVVDLQRTGSKVFFTVRWSNVHAQDHVLAVSVFQDGKRLIEQSTYHIPGKAKGEKVFSFTVDGEATFRIAITDVGGSPVKEVVRRK
ncbi:MAG: hypothetical protein QGG50_07720 [Methanopyri archaeon]|nr:hypothetical protein [Methanopyri archaeon]